MGGWNLTAHSTKPKNHPFVCIFPWVYGRVEPDRSFHQTEKPPICLHLSMGVWADGIRPVIYIFIILDVGAGRDPPSFSSTLGCR
jgi:hypothetical protein